MLFHTGMLCALLGGALVYSSPLQTNVIEYIEFDAEEDDRSIDEDLKILEAEESN